MKVIRIMLFKIVNQSMENTNKIIEKNNSNLKRSPGDGHCPPILLIDMQLIFSIFIMNSYSVY